MNTLDWLAVEKFVAERGPVSVSAGLLEDWYWTAATVYEDGKWDKERAYVTSSWATPGFKAEMPNGDVIEVEAIRAQTEEEAQIDALRREKNRKELREMVERLKAARQ